MICVLGVGWWWGEERTKQALQAQMVIEKLLSFFLVRCLLQLPLAVRYEGTDWLEGRAVSNLPFHTARNKSTVGALACDYLKLPCCSAGSFH